jgi:aspartate aminotransferase
MGSVASETYTSVCAPIQHAAVSAFRGGVEIERYLWHARRILAMLGRQCAQVLSDAGIRVHWPVGAFYVFADFSPLRDLLRGRGITGGIALCDQLLADTGVAVLPGSAFGRSRGELTTRLSYVDFDGARAIAASENTPLDQELPASFAEHWCRKVIVGVQRIADWIRGEIEPVSHGAREGEPEIASPSGVS